MDNIVINVTESVEDVTIEVVETELVENVTIEVAEISEWLAETVSQEEAEAGTATDRRAWTAQRVKQAIEALGGGETLWEADDETTIKPKLDKTVNHDKITGLGDAATKNVGTGSGDVAAGNDSRLSDAREPTSHDNTKHSTNYEPELNADQKRKITYGTADPTGGSDGDIYLQYED